MQRLKVNFFLKGDKTKDGLNAIYGKIKLGGSNCTFSTNRYISKDRWDKTNGLRNALRVDNEKSLKEYIYSMPLQLEQAYTQQIKALNGNNIDSITAMDLKNICFGGKPKQETTLFEVVKKHNEYFSMKVGKGDRADGSMEKYERMADVLKEFLPLKYNITDIEVTKIDSNFVFGLDTYLRFERKHGAIIGLGHNTTVKYIRNIAAMFNYAVKHGYIKENPFKCYSEVLKDVDTVYLTEEELERIENKTFDIRRLEVIKDIFLFSCYTSYAPIDAMSLTWDNIEKDGNGNLWIMKNRHKTKVTANVLVIPPLKRILDKYKNDPECAVKKLLIPNRSNTNVNAYLKEIADLCGITKNLTWYVSRHTFATTVALANDMPLAVIAKIMGHKRITQTQHYARIMDSSVGKEMLRVAEMYN